MNFKQQTAFLTLASAVLLVVGCSSEPKQASTEAQLAKTSQATAEAGGGHYVVVDFAKGGKTLDEADKEKLRNLASQAPHNGKIAEYEVLAWADREYPTEGQKATSQEVDLAQGRADAIKDFMKKDLSTTESVNGHNMAKRPGSVAELFKTDDYKTKNTFQGTGAAPSDHATAINKIENKASKAVIFVKYE
jgi:hypothetical protein